MILEKPFPGLVLFFHMPMHGSRNAETWLYLGFVPKTRAMCHDLVLLLEAAKKKNKKKKRGLLTRDYLM